MCPESTRRDFLKIGGLAGLGLFTARGGTVSAAPPRRAAKAKSVVLIFNCGGPSHIDLWDPKPQAPDTVRGPFRPIATNVAGMRVTEILPRLAKRADKLAIVRSVHHSQSSHNAAMYWAIVGQPYRVDSTLINPSRSDLPSLGTLVGWLSQRGGYRGSLPPYVITPAPHCDSTQYITPGQFGGVMGPAQDPYVLNADPNAADFKVSDMSLVEGMTADRLIERRALLQRFESVTRLAEIPAAREIGLYQAKAIAMVTAPEVKRTFDLTREPAEVRARYGRNSWGQSHLLARRLVEAGVPFVTTVNGPSITWDTHKDNFTQMKDRLVPPMEQAFVALLDDLSDRGLLDSTIVLWMGDFGRTPQINKDAGRDHWPQCFSAVLAGGGLRVGQVIGESDATGSYPASYAVEPADIHATVLTQLGYDPSGTTYLSSDGRPLPLSYGKPIRALL